MTKENTNAEPWVDLDGRIQSDEVLKKISVSWDADTWERFLSATVDRSQREKLLPPKEYQYRVDKLEKHVWSDFDESTFSDTPLKATVRRYIRSSLTLQQQTILRMIFWEEKSQRSAARSLGVDVKQVRVQLRNSLKKLKPLLERNASVLPYMPAPKNFSGSPEEKLISEVHFKERT